MSCLMVDYHELECPLKIFDCFVQGVGEGPEF